MLVKNVKKKFKLFFFLFKLTMKIFDYKEIFILFYVAKSTSFEVKGVLKISTFAAKLINL